MDNKHQEEKKNKKHQVYGMVAQKCFTFFPFLAAFPSSSHFEQRFVFIFSSYAEALAAEKTGRQVVLDQVQIAHPP